MEKEIDIKSVNLAWNAVTKALKPGNKETETTAVSREEFNSAISVLHQNGMSHIIRDWFMTSYQDDLNSKIIPEFWNIFHACEEDAYFAFPNAMNVLYDRIQSYLPALSVLQLLHENLLSKINSLPPDVQRNINNKKTPVKTEFFSVSGALVFAKADVDFWHKLMCFFDQAFKSYQSKYKYVKEEEPVLECIFCCHSIDQCCCEKYVQTFDCTIKILYDLQLFKKVVGDIPMNVAQNAVERHVKESCNGNFELPMVKSLKLWLETMVVSWLTPFYGNSDNTETKMSPSYKDRLINILYDAYTAIRMEQLFDIIIEFPESLPALEDLKECLEINNMRSKLISSLKKSLKSRLLHAGVNTSDILTAYISAIKALRVLDQSGVVLQVVSEPVCKYLRSREDTVRCIISSLREDSCGELACELMKGVPLKLEDNYPSDEEVEDWEKWCPDPVDVDPAKTNESQRSSDIIGILVNIYGSKELFVNEYRSLLADRILTTFSYNTEREIRYLELLKLRFGESQLHFCEVMLKDIADSKRLNSHLNSGEVKSYDLGDFPVNTMILSAQFWPSFKEEKLRLPDYIWKHLQNYTTAFEALKGNRTLVWKPHLGNVDLDVELKGRTLSLSVSPVHATILWHFQEKSRWTVPELSNKIQLQASVLRRKITFWQNHGVLNEEENDVFVLNEEQNTTNRESVVMVEEEEESVTASSQDMKEEELQTFWSFIVGMLTNMDSLPLERIHSMLRMFAVQGTSSNECSIQDMKQFLEKKVRDRQLVYSAGMFRLPKFDS